MADPQKIPSATQAQIDRAVKSATNAGLSISKLVVEGNRIEVIIDSGENGEKTSNILPLKRIPRA